MEQNAKHLYERWLNKFLGGNLDLDVIWVATWVFIQANCEISKYQNTAGSHIVGRQSLRSRKQ